MKEVERKSLKYSKMSFEDFFKKWKAEINEDQKKEYDKSNWFMKMFLNKTSETLEKPHIESIAKTFFSLGQLQMVSDINSTHFHGGTQNG